MEFSLSPSSLYFLFHIFLRWYYHIRAMNCLFSPLLSLFVEYQYFFFYGFPYQKSQMERKGNKKFFIVLNIPYCLIYKISSFTRTLSSLVVLQILVLKWARLRCWRWQGHSWTTKLHPNPLESPPKKKTRK